MSSDGGCRQSVRLVEQQSPVIEKHAVNVRPTVAEQARMLSLDGFVKGALSRSYVGSAARWSVKGFMIEAWAWRPHSVGC